MADFKIEILDDEFVEFYSAYDIPQTDELMQDDFNNQFVKINNEFYDLSDFIKLDSNTEYTGFHGIASQSYFHSYLIMLSDCGTCYKIAKLTC